jgi:hypothetical protein
LEALTSLLPGRKMKFEGRNILAHGMAGMKRNALPGLALWSLALLLILANQLVPAARAAFESVAGWKVRYGFVPFLFLLVTGRIRRGRGAPELAFYLLFWAYKGIEVDLLYRLQSRLFGDQGTFGIVVRKVLVDQFIYNPLWAAPTAALVFMWKEDSFSFRALRSRLGMEFLTFSVPVTLLSTWVVWLPSVAIIYCLPSPLQIPLFDVVLCFWVLVLSFISKT